MLDGLKAVHALAEVVIASWVTQHGYGRPSYASGVRETAILAEADYIMVGNTRVHGEKRILSVPHEEITAPWLISRAQHPEQNRIWAWEREPENPMIRWFGKPWGAPVNADCEEVPVPWPTLLALQDRDRRRRLRLPRSLHGDHRGVPGDLPPPVLARGVRGPTGDRGIPAA